jgi:hypothetical protein
LGSDRRREAGCPREQGQNYKRQSPRERGIEIVNWQTQRHLFHRRSEPRHTRLWPLRVIGARLPRYPVFGGDAVSGSIVLDVPKVSCGPAARSVYAKTSFSRLKSSTQAINAMWEDKLPNTCHDGLIPRSRPLIPRVKNFLNNGKPFGVECHIFTESQYSSIHRTETDGMEQQYFVSQPLPLHSKSRLNCFLRQRPRRN